MARSEKQISPNFFGWLLSRMNFSEDGLEPNAFDHSLANSRQNGYAQSPHMVRTPAANVPCQPAFGGGGGVGGSWSRRPSAFCPGQDSDVLTAGASALRHCSQQEGTTAPPLCHVSFLWVITSSTVTCFPPQDLRDEWRRGELGGSVG